MFSFFISHSFAFSFRFTFFELKKLNFNKHSYNSIFQINKSIESNQFNHLNTILSIMSATQLFSKTSSDDQSSSLSGSHSIGTHYNSSTATTATTSSSLTSIANQSNHWNNFGGQQYNSGINTNSMANDHSTTNPIQPHLNGSQQTASLTPSPFSTKLINDSQENANNLHSNVHTNSTINPLSSILNGHSALLSGVQTSISPDWYNTQDKLQYQAKHPIANSTPINNLSNNWTSAQKWTHQQQYGNYGSSMHLNQQVDPSQTMINPTSSLHSNAPLYKSADFGDCHAKPTQELKWFYRDPQGKYDE